MFFQFAGLQSAPGLGNDLTSTFTEGASDAFCDAAAANGPSFDMNEGSNTHLGLPTSMLECLVPNVSPVGLPLDFNGILTDLN